MAVYDTKGNEKSAIKPSQQASLDQLDASFAPNPGQQAEIDRLNASYHSSSNVGSRLSSNKSTPGEQMAGGGADKGISSGKVSGLGLIGENSAFQKTGAGAGTKDDTVGKGWQPSGEPKKSSGGDEPTKSPSVRKRSTRNILTGSVIGLILTGMGGLGVSTVSSPLEIIHYSQRLQGHFKSQEETADGRVSKAIRYVRYKGSGTVEKTNLGYFANKYADGIEAKQRAAGWESAYTQNFGFLDGYFIDQTKLANTPLSTLQGKSNADIIKYFKDTHGITVTERGNRLFISAQGMNNRQVRQLVKLSLGQTGLNGRAGVLNAHFMAKRAKVTLHPFKAADAKVLKAVDQKLTSYQERKAEKTRIYNEQQTKYVTKGATTATLSTKITPQGEQAPAQDTTAVDESAKNGSSEGTKANTDLQEGKSGTYTRFISGTTGKVALGGAGAAGLLCLGKATLDAADEAEKIKVIEPMIRMGMYMIAAGGAIMHGTADNKEISVEQIGQVVAKTRPFAKEVSKNQEGQVKTEKVGGFSDARSYQAEAGDQQSGPDIDKAARVSGTNPVKAFLDALPLGPICSTTGTIIVTAISFLGGPVTTVITTAVMAVYGDELINGMARWISGAPVNPIPRGADYGNYANYGARYAANDSAMSSGGAEIPDSNTSAYTEQERTDEKQEFAKQSVAYKLFDPYDANSMVSTFIDGQSPSASQNFATFASSFMNIGKRLASLPQDLLVPSAHAAKAYNYQFPKFGFTKQDADNPLYGIPQENTEKVIDEILPSDKGDEYIARAKTCFGVTITKDGTLTVDDSIVEYKKIKGKGCTDAESGWMRVRFFILDEHTAMSIACNEGDATKCSELGVGQTGTASLLESRAREYANRTPEDNSVTNVMGSWYSLIKNYNLQGASH